MRISRAARVALVAFAAVWVASGGVGRKTFRSQKFHYTVRYPASWFLFTSELRPSLDYLDILSFPPSERVEGVVLRSGGAEIRVGRAPSHVRTVQSWVREDTRFDNQVEKHKVEHFVKSRSGCRELLEVTSRWEVGPGTNLVRTTYYCATRHGLYAVFLTNWEGDSNEAKLRAIALKVAVSLRSW